MYELILFYANGDDANLSLRSLTLRMINKKANEMVLRFITKCNILGPSNHFVSLLRNLTEINLYNSKIKIETLMGLTALNSIKLNSLYEENIFSTGLGGRLTNLAINNRHVQISPLHFRDFTRLTSLSLQDNIYFSPTRGHYFMNLTKLELLGYNDIQDRDFIQMTALKSLKIDNNLSIYGERLHLLPSLIDLSLSNSSNISDGTLSQLTNLTSLNLFKNWVITKPTLLSLVNLTSLSWRYGNSKHVDRKELYNSLPLLKHFNTNKENHHPHNDFSFYNGMYEQSHSFLYIYFSRDITLFRYRKNDDLIKYFQPITSGK